MLRIHSVTSHSKQLFHDEMQVPTSTIDRADRQAKIVEVYANATFIPIRPEEITGGPLERDFELIRFSAYNRNLNQ